MKPCCVSKSRIFCLVLLGISFQRDDTEYSKDIYQYNEGESCGFEGFRMGTGYHCKTRDNLRYQEELEFWWSQRFFVMSEMSVSVAKKFFKALNALKMTKGLKVSHQLCQDGYIILGPIYGAPSASRLH